MSNLIDKLRTLINAQMRGPRKPSKPHPPARPQPAAPPPEVSEGRARKPRAEVSESTPPAVASAPAPLAGNQPPATSSSLDEGRVADMLKTHRKK